MKMHSFTATQARLSAMGRQARQSMRPRDGGALLNLLTVPLSAPLGRMAAFMEQWACGPRVVGAVCPSGARLARHMAALVPPGDGLVVELGAGTGAVTRALRAGLPPQRLLVLERLPAFCRLLRDRFPDLTVIQGDAARLCDYLPHGHPVTAVVSSLPLLSLPAPTREAIVAQMRAATAGGGRIIQFTYSLWGASPLVRAGCCCEKRSLVLRNLPPARVECFRT